MWKNFWTHFLPNWGMKIALVIIIDSSAFYILRDRIFTWLLILIYAIDDGITIRRQYKKYQAARRECCVWAALSLAVTAICACILCIN